MFNLCTIEISKHHHIIRKLPLKITIPREAEGNLALTLNLPSKIMLSLSMFPKMTLK
jgi:hypothetical protein